jgi:hypothetical protein
MEYREITGAELAELRAGIRRIARGNTDPRRMTVQNTDMPIDPVDIPYPRGIGSTIVVQIFSYPVRDTELENQ